MGKLSLGKGIKEFLGLDEVAEEKIEDELELTEETKEKKVDKKIEKKVENINEELEIDDENKNSVSEEEEEDPLDNCQTIFIDPRSFTDCKKIANYIKNERMVTLNLEYLDTDTAQRMMDFLMGAMLVMGASFIEISKKVYTSVPKTVKVHYDGKKNMNDKVFLNIREN